MTKHAVSVAEFFSRFPDERSCIRHIHRTKFGNHRPCPHCGDHGGWSYIRGTKKFLHRCRRHVSVLAGTPFYRSNLSMLAVFYTMLLFANSSSGVRCPHTKKELGLGQKTAHRLNNLIRLQMAYLQEPKCVGGDEGPVEIDEVYLRYFKDPAQAGLQAKIAMGLYHDGKVQCGFIDNRRRSQLEGPIQKLVSPGSIVMTDQFSGYDKLRDLGYRHRTVNHSKGEFYRKGVSTSAIDSCWASFRRAFRLYHQIGIENAWLYLAEAQFRYNHRHNPRAAFETLISCWPEVDVRHHDDVRSRYVWNGEAGWN